MELFYCLENRWIVLETLQFLIVTEKCLLPVHHSDKVDCCEVILGDTKPFLRMVAVLIELDRFVQGKVTVELLLRVLQSVITNHA